MMLDKFTSLFTPKVNSIEDVKELMVNYLHSGNILHITEVGSYIVFYLKNSICLRINAPTYTKICCSVTIDTGLELNIQDVNYNKPITFFDRIYLSWDLFINDLDLITEILYVTVFEKND